MEDELELPEDVERLIEPGMIDISQVLGTRLASHHVIARVNHHFRESDLGYKPVSADTFKLRIRSRKYPLFGAFAGRVHIIADAQAPGRYKIEGLLRFRLSVLWFLAVLAFFFLLTVFTHAGLWLGAFIEALGAGIAIYTSYQLGRAEAREVDERVHASFLRLRTTIQNIR